jgi:hypothetical protein
MKKSYFALLLVSLLQLVNDYLNIPLNQAHIPLIGSILVASSGCIIIIGEIDRDGFIVGLWVFTTVGLGDEARVGVEVG